ncbi:MAG: hypothetical protein MUF64_31025 [Polyangiaceae bacterium]|jgi:hypothetical protein|nr:hypothetical protein [Polyangiaceae bacterium]
MKAVVTDKRPCKLGRGEMRRVPQDRSFRGLVGYHVGCPRCGFVTIALQGDEGLEITESAGSEVTFSRPVRCVFCSALVGLQAGELGWEEDALSRPGWWTRTSG